MIKVLSPERSFRKILSSATTFQVAILGLLMITFAVRLWRLGAESAWIDEAYSIQLARHNLMQIIRGTIEDQHPFLYYWLLHYWLKLSDSVWNARLLSVIFGVLNIGQVIYFGKVLKDRWLGFVAAAILAFSPTHIWYSQEARMYIFLLVLTTASTFALWQALNKSGWQNWLSFGVFSVLALYTHNFAAFILIAQGFLTLIFVLRYRQYKTLLSYFLVMSVSFLCYLPWIKVVIYQAQYHSMDWLETPEVGEVRDAFIRLLIGYHFPFLPSFIRWVGIGLFAALLVWSYYRYVKSSQDRLNQLFLFSFWGLIPFCLVSLISLQYPIFQFKQFLILLVPLTFLILLMIQAIPGRFSGFLLIVLIVLSGAVSGYQQIELSKDKWRMAADYIRLNFEEGDMVYSNPSAASLAIQLYAPEIDGSSYDGYPQNYNIIRGGWAEGQKITDKVSEEVLNKLPPHRRVWFVEFVPSLWDPDQILEEEFLIDHNLVDDRTFTRIRLRLYIKKAEH